MSISSRTSVMAGFEQLKKALKADSQASTTCDPSSAPSTSIKDRVKEQKIVTIRITSF